MYSLSPFTHCKPGFPSSIYFIFNAAKITALHIEKTAALTDGIVVPLIQFPSYPNSFSYERFCTQTRFETEAQDKSEMAYYNNASICMIL